MNVSSGELASQEELDSVINLLSGLTSQGQGQSDIALISSMSPGTGSNICSIYSNQEQLGVPMYSQGHNSTTSLSEISDDLGMTLKGKGQRRSEGSIDLTGVRGQNSPAYNTWHYQHRASLPGE